MAKQLLTRTAFALFLLLPLASSCSRESQYRISLPGKWVTEDWEKTVWKNGREDRNEYRNIDDCSYILEISRIADNDFRVTRSREYYDNGIRQYVEEKDPDWPSYVVWTVTDNSISVNGVKTASIISFSSTRFEYETGDAFTQTSGGNLIDVETTEWYSYRKQ